MGGRDQSHLRLTGPTFTEEQLNQNTYADCHALAVLSTNAGKGNGPAPHNPTKALNTLRQLAGNGRHALLAKNTKLYCREHKSLQRVIDAFAGETHSSIAKLECGCKRETSTMSREDYVALVNRAAKIKITRKGVSGGVAIIEDESPAAQAA
jgi:hypothetical protein